MTKKMNEVRKGLVVNALVAIGLLFLAGGLFLYRWFQLHPEQPLTEGPAFWLALSIGVLGVTALVVVLRKSLRIDQNVAKLNQEYDLVYEQFSQYIGVSGLSYFAKKELTHELLSLFLEAQEAGKGVDDLIGADHQEFIDGMIRAYGVSKSSLVVDLMTGLQYFIFYMIAGQFFYYVKIAQHEPISYFEAPMDYTTLLFFALSAFIIIPYISQYKRTALLAHQAGQRTLGVGNILIPTVLTIGGFIGTIEILTRFFADVPWVATFLQNGVVFISSGPILTLAILVGTVGLHFLKKYLRKVQL